MGYIKSNEHFCELDSLARKGTLLDCDVCHAKWWCKPSSLYESKWGSWVRISDAKFTKLSGQAAEKVLDEPGPKRVGWFKRKFQLDKYPQGRLKP